ncbi:MAG: prolyl oligopeptidase family serine peptidase [Micromonosporaceae bacterium]|nr:prolyl oligopeptidase family serine peptidase [Micromonosporaceae bacterium]
MTTPTVTRYGEWVSPISAEALTTAARRLSFPTMVGDQVWWVEDRPAEGGRTTVLVRRADGRVEELLPAPWSARSRVHEYGGRAFLALPVPGGHALLFVHFADQRLYRLDPTSTRPRPLTPEPATDGSLRYADLVLSPGGAEIWCVRERHRDGDLDRHIVTVPTDGRAATDPAAVREVVGGSRFLANPRLSPDGTRVAWLAWDHPAMPWDGTELRVGALSDGRVTDWSTVLGGPAESVFQPEWDGDDHLVAASDRSGWWNLYRVPAGGGQPTPLHPAEEEFGVPLWQLGAATWGWLGDGRLLCLHGTGTQQLGILDPATGALTDLDLPYQSYAGMVAVDRGRALVVASAPSRPTAVVLLDLGTVMVDVVRTTVDPDTLPDPAYLPVAVSTTLPGPDGREVHVHVYPPRNPEHTAPPGTLPPYVVFVHGGPTSQSPAALDLAKAYLTSRGIGVLDVNYGGSAGYGRAYRCRLTGQWGIVDVQDAAAAAAALVERGDADPERLAIRGGSAGGWTTLCAVTETDQFAAGTSLFGVADVRRLAATTHDFESRYVEMLVGPGATGPGPDRRSPLPRAGATRCPVLLLQGADDPIVPVEQAEAFRDALAAAGVPHALLVFPGEHHGFRKAESIVAAAEAELSFYGQVMGFIPPGVPTQPLTRPAAI